MQFIVPTNPAAKTCWSFVLFFFANMALKRGQKGEKYLRFIRTFTDTRLLDIVESEQVEIKRNSILFYLNWNWKTEWSGNGNRARKMCRNIVKKVAFGVCLLIRFRFRFFFFFFVDNFNGGAVSL